MKSLIKIFITVFLVFGLNGCFANDGVNVEELHIENNEVVYEDLKLKENFTISFWIKPLENHLDTTILTIADKDKAYSLVNDSMDEEYYTIGLNILNENGLLYADGSNYLETYNYNFVVVDYYENTFFLYLNNKLIGEKSFDDGIDFESLKVTFGSENAKADFKNIKISEHLEKEKVDNLYLENARLRLDDLRPNVVDKMVIIPNDERIVDVVFDEELFFKNGKDIESRDLQNGQITLNCHVDGIDVNKTIDVEFNNLLEKTLNAAIVNLGSTIYEKDVLISNLNDYEIGYEVLEGNADYDFNNHYLVKNKDAVEREKIKIKITVSKAEETISQELSIVLLDEKYGQVLATFAGEDGWPEHVTGEESIYFYLGKDMQEWTKLNDDKAVVTEDGTNRFRDPHLSRDKDGNFIIVATEGYANPSFYVAQSMDLIDFDVQQVKANTFDKTIDNKGQITWAPECYYDNLNDEYIIHYSESGEQANSIYAVTTKDFEDYSYPYRLFDAGHQVIDSNITHINNHYFMFYKNEEADSKRIYLAVTDDLNNPNWQQYENFEYNFYGYDQEGPFVYKNGEDYFLFADAYRDEFISYGEFHDNCYDWWQPIQNEELNELGVLRHFSIIDVTEKEYQRLEEYYGR